MEKISEKDGEGESRESRKQLIQLILQNASLFISKWKYIQAIKS